MATVSMTYARQHFAELCERAFFHNETIVITKGRNERVALIPIKNINHLEEIERSVDIASARQASLNLQQGAATIPLEEASQYLEPIQDKKPLNIKTASKR